VFVLAVAMGERIVYSFSLSKTFDAMDGIVLVFVVELWPMKRMTLQEKGKKRNSSKTLHWKDYQYWYWLVLIFVIRV